MAPARRRGRGKGAQPPPPIVFESEFSDSSKSDEILLGWGGEGAGEAKFVSGLRCVNCASTFRNFVLK